MDAPSEAHRRIDSGGDLQNGTLPVGAVLVDPKCYGLVTKSPDQATSHPSHRSNGTFDHGGLTRAGGNWASTKGASMRSTEQIRNVVLVGHNASGKTSLAEALLFRAGTVARPGTVEKGSTVMDHDPEERERRQSISMSVASFDWNDHRINLVDTPGYADFRGEALLGLSAADLAVFVIDGVAGVQSQDEVLWRQAAEMGIPRIVFVNKLDRERSSFDRTLAQVREVFGSHADPTELPIGEESSFHGVTDVLTHHAFVYDSGRAEPAEVPADLAEAERAEHEHLV